MSQAMKPRWRLVLVPLLVPLMLPLLLHGCPPIQQGRFDPEPILRRAERRTAQGVSVDLAALSAAEANALVGFDITKAGIQPVWVRVRNLEGVRYYIPPISIDDDYFSPHEVAWKGHRWFDPAGNSRLDQRLRGLDLPEAVEPGGMVGGYVFTNRDEGLKYANVELVAPGQRKVRRFPFLVKVPGLRTDFQRVNWQHLLAPGRQQDLEEPALRRWLEELPCCTLGGDRRTPADPLNIVLIGSADTVLPPLARRDWHVTQTLSVTSAWRTLVSSLFGRPYRYSPVSSLYLFGRPQDIALQKARGNVNQRNHMRLWLAPVTLRGQPVWVGQISRDIGVRLTARTLTTHKIDAEVDETRWYLMQDLFFSESLHSFNFVPGVGVSTWNHPRTNYTGDPYVTDGLRAVLWLSSAPVTYHRVVTRWPKAAANRPVPDPRRTPRP